MTVREEEMARYIGVYLNGERRWEVQTKEGKLFLKHQDALMTLTKIGDSRFSIGDLGGGALLFVPDESGTIQYLHLGLYAAQRVINPK